MNHHIVCKKLAPGTHAHEHVTHVMIKSSGLVSVARVMQNMKDGDEYFVTDVEGGHDVRVHVNIGPLAVFPYAPYIQTAANGKWANHLLGLPDCRGE